MLIPIKRVFLVIIPLPHLVENIVLSNVNMVIQDLKECTYHVEGVAHHEFFTATLDQSLKAVCLSRQYHQSVIISQAHETDALSSIRSIPMLPFTLMGIFLKEPVVMAAFEETHTLFHLFDDECILFLPFRLQRAHAELVNFHHYDLCQHPHRDGTR